MDSELQTQRGWAQGLSELISTVGDYRPVPHFAPRLANENAVDLVERVDFELRFDLARSYECQDVNQIGGIVMRRPYYRRLLEQHLNRIGLNGLSTHSRCDQTTAAPILHRLTVLFHGRREGQPCIHPAHFREFLAYVILYDKYVVRSHGFRILLLIGRVGNSHNFVPHRFGHLQSEMTQAANSNYRDTFTRLGPRRAVGAHS